MRKVTFCFADEKNLRQFIIIIRGKPLQISFSERTVSCECGEAEIELAVKGFNATVVEQEGKTNFSS